MKLTSEQQETALSLLCFHLRESESRCFNNDPTLTRWVTQTYDFLNKIGYTTARPRWEK